MSAFNTPAQGCELRNDPNREAKLVAGISCHFTRSDFDFIELGWRRGNKTVPN
jgi:hypothetical protein